MDSAKTSPNAPARRAVAAFGPTPVTRPPRNTATVRVHRHTTLDGEPPRDDEHAPAQTTPSSDAPPECDAAASATPENAKHTLNDRQIAERLQRGLRGQAGVFVDRKL